MPAYVKLNNIVKTRYDIDLLAGSMNADHLLSVYEHYREQRDVMSRVLGESAMTGSTEYTKAFLISEAVLLILREIAPKRLKKKSKGAQ